ncbi:hypothetical protein VTI28DRAFT_3657 [Corynascus sepedonium]
MADSTKPISNFRQPIRFITAHNTAGKAIVHSREPLTWSAHDDNKLAFAVPYTTSTFPPDLNGDADLAAHERVVAGTGEEALGLVNPSGTVLRYVDFAPGYACGMHRTRSLDYGVVLEGEIDMVLDGDDGKGERRTLRRGDVAIQRATMHQWVNRSQTEWARVVFILQDSAKLYVGDKEMGEDLGKHSDLPPSRQSNS